GVRPQASDFSDRPSAQDNHERLLLKFEIRVRGLKSSVRTSLLLHAGIIAWVDVVDLKRGRAVNLHDCLSDGHGIVMHAGIEVRKTSGRECVHGSGIELISHTDLETPGNDG